MKPFKGKEVVDHWIIGGNGLRSNEGSSYGIPMSSYKNELFAIDKQDLSFLISGFLSPHTHTYHDCTCHYTLTQGHLTLEFQSQHKSP